MAEYQAGLDAYNAGNYTRALAEWKAEVTGEPDRARLAIYREANYAIAMLYWLGEGVEQDYGKSAIYMKQAAEMNHAGAQTKLGYLYSTGQGVPKNDGQAEKWFRMAVAQGDADAQHNLEVMLGANQPTPLASSEPVEEPPEPEMEVVPEPEPEPEIVTEEPEIAVFARPKVEVVAEDLGEEWIKKQNPEHYTIQVIALSDPEKLYAFIEEQADWMPFAIYRQAQYENPLWVLVQGNYSDVEAARLARDTFPPGLQKRDELWIRKFGMVQRLVE